MHSLVPPEPQGALKSDHLALPKIQRGQTLYRGWGPVDTFECQTADLVRSSKKYPRLFTMLYQLRSNLKEHGVFGTSRKVWSKFVVGSTPVDPRLANKATGTASITEVL